MSLLLDTHVVVWLISGELRRLPPPIADGLLSALDQGRTAVSAATFWELTLKLCKRPARLPPLPPTCPDYGPVCSSTSTPCVLDSSDECLPYLGGMESDSGGVTVFDLFESAERMIEARLRRERPAVTDAEVRAAIDEWASGGDRHLDADGYLREVSVPDHWQ